MSDKEKKVGKHSPAGTGSRKQADWDEYDALIDGGKAPAAKKAAAKKPAAKKAAAKKPAAKKSAGKKEEAWAAYDALTAGDEAPAKKKNTGAQETGSAQNSPKTSPVKKKPAVGSEPYDELDDAFPVKKPRKRAAPARVDKDGMDEYDRLMAAVAPETSKPKKKSGGLGMALTLLLFIGGMAALGLRQYSIYQEFQEMRRTVEQQTFYQGTTVDGVDVSGMTLDEALLYWENSVEPLFGGVTVQLQGGPALTAVQLGYTSDYAAVLESAWSAGRSGSLEQRYREISRRAERPAQSTVHRQLYSEDVIDSYVSTMAESVDGQAEDAHVKSFDPDTCTFVFAEGHEGYELDQAQLRSDIISALDEGGGTVTPDVRRIDPKKTLAQIEDSYGMITSAVTSASSSTDARLNNIRLALASIDGLSLKPGEEFSFNTIVGKRTTERGYKKAPAFSSGEVTTQVGGGICQVSTTVFNAAVKADLEITERHNHSIPVGYVDKGKDATVDWGSQDLKFKNTSSDTIYIHCYLTDKKRVMVEIYGKLLPNGEYITVEAKTTETLYSKVEYRTNSFLSPNANVTVQEGRNGYNAAAYKIRWNSDGSMISKELLCTSRYPARNTIIERGW